MRWRPSSLHVPTGALVAIINSILAEIRSAQALHVLAKSSFADAQGPIRRLAWISLGPYLDGHPKLPFAD